MKVYRRLTQGDRQAFLVGTDYVYVLPLMRSDRVLAGVHRNQNIVCAVCCGPGGEALIFAFTKHEHIVVGAAGIETLFESVAAQKC